MRVPLLTTELVLEEIMAGGGLTMAAAAHRFQGHKGAGHLDPSTLWRWAVKGIALADGTRLQLEAARLGAGLRTSEEALRRFLVAQAAAGSTAQAAPPRSPRQRQTAAEKAAASLDKMGL